MLLDCGDGESNQSNRWLIEEIEFIDDQSRTSLQKY